MSKAKDVLKTIKENEIEWVDLRFTDPKGKWQHLTMVASVMGEEGLTEVDRRFLAFGDLFEARIVAQEAGRTLEDSMRIGWELLRTLPAAELTRLSRAQVGKYLRSADA